MHSLTTIFKTLCEKWRDDHLHLWVFWVWCVNKPLIYGYQVGESNLVDVIYSKYVTTTTFISIFILEK